MTTDAQLKIGKAAKLLDLKADFDGAIEELESIEQSEASISDRFEALVFLADLHLSRGETSSVVNCLAKADILREDLREESSIAHLTERMEEIRRGNMGT